MAHDSFKVEVLTPEGEVFNDEVEMLSTRTTVGSIGAPLASCAPPRAAVNAPVLNAISWKRNEPNATRPPTR